ncbi:hypothetical protein MferCBS31731_005489 [Microsporum ferrugineum]
METGISETEVKQTIAKEPLTLISLLAEIQEAILCQLDCFRILKSAAASCRSFRDLVLYHPGRIVKQILRTSIPDDVIPEAFALYYSSKLPITNAKIVKDFIDDYFESLKKIPRPNLSLSEAVALEDYNRLVNNFARDFARTALSKHPITRVEEKCLCLQLTIPLKDHSKLFFDRFAPWENEQVACIQDFLLRLIDELYNDVAAHDVEWGEADIPFNEGYEAGDINGYRLHYLHPKSILLI